LFLPKNGEPLNNGELFRNEDLARTFELISNEGIGVFYNGTVGS